jgi:hypothetical protein
VPLLTKLKSAVNTGCQAGITGWNSLLYDNRNRLPLAP